MLNARWAQGACIEQVLACHLRQVLKGLKLIRIPVLGKYFMTQVFDRCNIVNHPTLVVYSRDISGFVDAHKTTGPGSYQRNTLSLIKRGSQSNNKRNTLA